MGITSISRIIGGLFILALVLFLTLSPPTALHHQSSDVEPDTHVIATVGSHSITMAEIRQAIALPLYQAEEHRSKLLNETIQRLVDEKLLLTEATRIGVTVPVLLERASQSESIAKLANLPSPIRTVPPPPSMQTLSPPLRTAEEASRIRQALLVQLRRNTPIHIDLFKPELPILHVSADDDPWTGTAHAPITIIEFSDFECPYCKSSLPILNELLTTYPGQLKLVYRDFPGPNHHQALPAAEAAQCAAEQNQFWKYHDALFNTQDPGTLWNFSALAKEVGLNPSLFDTCMKEHRYRQEVLKDLQDGLSLHVTSTPTFFINGRPLVGAQSLGSFQAIIDPLLQHPSTF